MSTKIRAKRNTTITTRSNKSRTYSQSDAQFYQEHVRVQERDRCGGGFRVIRKQISSH